ncbi:MAG: DUF2254 domain-containing protein [Myxococcales bacterium]|nr:DUF2254 domain-containing protein [Myxococcales bacterium]
MATATRDSAQQSGERPLTAMRLVSDPGLGLFLAVVGAAIGLLVVLIVVEPDLSTARFDALADAAMGEGLVDALGSLAEVLAAVLGLSLTVVAIVVQLASQRYSAKIVDLFMRDPINVGAFGFMVVSCIYVVLLPALAHGSAPPRIAIVGGILLAVINFGLLLPYFRYVFSFLQPDNIITAIERSAERSLAPITNGERSEASVADARETVATAIERISDNCLAAIGQQDRNLALHSVRTIERFVCRYHAKKARLPPSWAHIDAEAFASLSEGFYDDIVAQGLWVEAKSLLEFEHVLRRSLGDMNELVSQIASSTREIGESALRHDEQEAIALAIRFFNTYIRHGLNAGNVRAVYNILDQYRRMASALMRSGPELVDRVVKHLVYYGRTANERGIPFVTVTVAHDVRVLCQEAYSAGRDVVPLLDRFLTLDQKSESTTGDIALMGVRKAQSILGAFFLAAGAERLAQRIRDDMRVESPERLLRARDEILEIDEHKFFEITDRGFNFEYVEPSRHQFVRAFFQPFEERALGPNARVGA